MTNRKKTSETPCISCINYDISKYGVKSCKKRPSTDNEYGTFELGARCFYDIELLDDLYEPVSAMNGILTNIKKDLEKSYSENFKLKEEIKNLEEAIHNITSRGKSN